MTTGQSDQSDQSVKKVIAVIMAVVGMAAAFKGIGTANSAREIIAEGEKDPLVDRSFAGVFEALGTLGATVGFLLILGAVLLWRRASRKQDGPSGLPAA